MNVKQKNAVFVTVLFLVVWMFFIRDATAIQSPTEQIKPTLSSLIAILGDASLQGEEHKSERRAKIMALVKQSFDFREMSQRVVGKEWKTLPQEKQDHFQELFTKLLENAYIGKFEGYSGKEVQYLGERIKEDRAIVSIQIENNGQLVPVEYIMTVKAGQWLVYDINIEGVSLVRNYMEQFKSILRNEKFDGLIKMLEEKNQSFQ